MDELFCGGFDAEGEPHAETPHNRHYIAANERGRITEGWGNGPHPGRDTSGAMCVTGEGGCRLRPFPGGEGPRYKLL
ncbi:MAG: hypothetical protein HFF25_09480 [Oscillospiraceae bacterium]|jgi:hypothetical protein|nr:hypothetical protein [Oscillospiraceae bacterium]